MRLAFVAFILAFLLSPTTDAIARDPQNPRCQVSCWHLCMQRTYTLPFAQRQRYCNQRCIAQCYPWSTRPPQAPILVTPVPRPPVPFFRAAPAVRVAPARVYRTPVYRAPVYRTQVYRPPVARPYVNRPVYRTPVTSVRPRASYPRGYGRGGPYGVR